jgi:hypothetical protein
MTVVKNLIYTPFLSSKNNFTKTGVNQCYTERSKVKFWESDLAAPKLPLEKTEEVREIKSVDIELTAPPPLQAIF